MLRKLSRKAMLTAFATALIALAAAAAAFAAPFDKSNGDIQWVTAIGSHAKANFDAHDTNPARGHVNVRNHDGVSFKGTVNCYHQDSANAATFSGTIDSFDGTNAPGNTQGTATFEVHVLDAGSPGNKGDMVSVVRGSAPFDCTAGGVAQRPVTHGNLHVHQQ